MNGQSRFELDVQGRLQRQASHEAPPDLLPRAMASVHRTPQRRSWHARLSSFMLPTLGAATLIAAVLIALIIGLLPQTPTPVGPSPTSTSTATGAPGPDATPTLSVVAALPGFTTNTPIAPDAAWTSLTWRKLASDDALAQVRKVVRWSGGFLALGIDQAVRDVTRTPVWTSSDGVTWTPLSPAVFGSDTIVFDVVQLPHGNLVALTAVGHTDGRATGPTQSWTSKDAVSWSAHDGPNLIPDAGLDSSQRPLIVAGPAGAIASSYERPLTIAISTDGARWTVLPSDALPKGFAMGGLAATVDGYMAVGAISVDTANNDRAAALWSTDGVHWTQTPRLVARGGMVLTASGPAPFGATQLLTGRSGFLALGRVFATPGADIWWQSGDGRQWQNLTDYPPLGPTTGYGEGVGGGPNGWVASDGQRFVAGRFTGSAAWVSADGLDWSPITVPGPPLADDPSHVTVLPGGVLLVQLTDAGDVAWFGEATSK
jgi:hypothetical protein